jgi:hypothetical protein
MFLDLNIFGYFGTSADKVRARKINLNTQMTMNLHTPIDSGKEDEP